MKCLLRWVLALPGVMALSACLVTPGKFESSLDIRADRSFSFAYKGEIIASDSGKGAMGLPEPASEDGEAAPAQLLQIAAEKFDSEADNGNDVQMRAIADALAKEKGFRSARYLGNRKFDIDYAINGRLTHAFLFPFNIDAQIVLPFVAVELRGEERVRVKAPGFANGFDKSQGPTLGAGGPGEDAAKALNGSFTLTTDAEIVSQNQEEGAQPAPNGKRIVWRVTPLTSEAPAATLRLQR
ncbi:hypothetical protein KRZ98_00045 [Sphingobium sp. AS12]|uniref:hypothetical protein n=1 Tax=Sphingobium sp. AS12 TaxID=2849495 RepID=UPI001C313D30|nr:hypothetical protein [Sphingobium sp. AS12]MBV2146682.1 hypothetical protein [Sphingobium sp. AS12]